VEVVDISFFSVHALREKIGEKDLKKRGDERSFVTQRLEGREPIEWKGVK